jgi:hypothetical protein
MSGSGSGWFQKSKVGSESGKKIVWICNTASICLPETWIRQNSHLTTRTSWPGNAFPLKEKFSVAEPHHVDAAPGPILLYTKPTFLKQAKVNMRLKAIFTLVSKHFWIGTKLNGRSNKLLRIRRLPLLRNWDEDWRKNVNVGYWISLKISVRYRMNTRQIFRPLVRYRKVRQLLSPISLITDIGLSAHLCYGVGWGLTGT